MKKTILLYSLAICTAPIIAQTVQPVKAVTKSTTAGPSIAAGSSQLTGIFYAPAGIGIVLQNNGKNDLVISPKKENRNAFSGIPFNFPVALAHGVKFNITAKKNHGRSNNLFLPGGLWRCTAKR